jgi:hypothetical protein
MKLVPPSLPRSSYVPSSKAGVKRVNMKENLSLSTLFRKLRIKYSIEIRSALPDFLLAYRQTDGQRSLIGATNG